MIDSDCWRLCRDNSFRKHLAFAKWQHAYHKNNTSQLNGGQRAVYRDLRLWIKHKDTTKTTQAGTWQIQTDEKGTKRENRAITSISITLHRGAGASVSSKQVTIGQVRADYRQHVPYDARNSTTNRARTEAEGVLLLILRWMSSLVILIC